MKKINKLVVVAIVALAMSSIQSCSKIFTTGELKGTWKLTASDETGESIDIYVDDTSVDGEVLKVSSTQANTLTTENSKTITTYDGAGTGDFLLSMTDETVKTATTYLSTRLYKFSNDSTYMDTTSYADNFTETNLSEITFENDGTFTAKISSSVENITNDVQTGYTLKSNYTVTSEGNLNGTWSYLGKNKNDKLEDNQRIGLWYTTGKSSNESKYTSSTLDTDAADGTDYTVTASTGTSKTESTSSMNESTPTEVWSLVSKSKDEMVIEFENSIDNMKSTTTGTNSSNPGVTTTSTSDNTSNSLGQRTYNKQ